MMPTKVMLLLEGVDFRKQEWRDATPSELPNVFFESSGVLSFATLLVEGGAMAVGSEAADVARMIHKTMPGVCVRESFTELVSVADIASRCSVTSESVRLWASGKRRSAQTPFPPVRQMAGMETRAMSLYEWPEVVAWAREVLLLDPEEGLTFLTHRQNAQLNLELADLADDARLSADHREPAWKPLRVPGLHLTEEKREVDITPARLRLERIETKSWTPFVKNVERRSALTPGKPEHDRLS